MKNWIDLGIEVKESVSSEPTSTYLQAKCMLTIIDGGHTTLNYGSLSRVSVSLYAGYITDIVSVQFTDSHTNPCDFDALYEEARVWWDNFKTSDHPILIDNQIKNTLNNGMPITN